MVPQNVPPLHLVPSEVHDLEAELASYYAIYSRFFRRSESRTWAHCYLRGLLSSLERKSIEPIVTSQFGPNQQAIRSLQLFLSNSPWDDTTILRQHWHEVNAVLGSADGMLIFGENDFRKRGNDSVGVQRQNRIDHESYLGVLESPVNCQVGLFASYASIKGATLLDRRLYLPYEWLKGDTYRERRRQCQIPAHITFKNTSQLALAMVNDIVVSKLLPIRWILGGKALGCDQSFLNAVAKLGLWYFCEVPFTRRIYAPAIPQAQTIMNIFNLLQRGLSSARFVTEGYEKTGKFRVYAEQIQAEKGSEEGRENWLILRIAGDFYEARAFISNAASSLLLDELARMSEFDLTIDHCLDVAKRHLGMSDYEVRGWRGWHHHMTLVILAHFFLVRLQNRPNKVSP